jgi:hypothetical protein
MSTMNGDTRKYAVKLLDARQKNDKESAGKVYNGPYCESGGYEKIDAKGISCRGGLVIHHRDNNNNNNPQDGSNWEYQCRGHNIRLDARGLAKPKDRGGRNHVIFNGTKISLKRVRGEKDSGEDKEVKMQSAEFEKNKRCEGVFRQFVEMIVGERCEAPANGLAEAGAEYTTQCFGGGNGIDQQTGMRYLRKMCAPYIGKFEMFDKNKGTGAKPDMFVRRRTDH